MSVAVYEPRTITESTLDELAAVATREHEAACEATASALEHWIAAGEALREVRDRLSWGEFGPWVDMNFQGMRGLAAACIRLAIHQDAIRSEGIQTVNRARMFIRGLPAPSAQSQMKQQEIGELAVEANRLREQGLSYPEIALLLGAHSGTIWRWLHPERYKLQLAKQRQARQEQKEKKEAVAQRTRDRAVRKAGGAVAEAYSYLRKTSEALGRAEREASSQEVRAAARGALAYAYKAEDEIVQALGIS